MKSCSHHTLGQYLTNTYMQEYPLRYRRAFSIGCIQPDKNPTTYFKGSIRWQWLRGHNWNNAKGYIEKTLIRLQSRRKLKLLDFYRLGKLIHYTADAFTYTHNSHFTDNLAAHRSYESELHEKFERYLLEYCNDYCFPFHLSGSICEHIIKNHKRYMHCCPSMDNDMDYCVRMCAQVLQLTLNSNQLLPA